MTEGGSSPAGWRMPVSLREALILFVLLRVGLSVYAIAVTFFFQVPPPCFHNGVVDWTSMPVLYSEGLEGRLFGVWERWDACWYLRIAEFGYEPGEPATAFFPLYPFAVRLLGPVMHGNLVLAALVISAIGFVAAMALLHSLVSTDLDRDTADRTILYLAVFPTAFFLFAPFTESIFLALAVAAIWAIRTGRLRVALIAALLVGLTRPQGVLLALPLGWEAIQLIRAGGFAPGSRLKAALAATTALAPAAGFTSFVLLSAIATGVSPFDAERQHWGYANAPPWDVLARAWQWMLDPANSGFADIQLMTAFHFGVIGIFVAAFVVGLRTLPMTYSLYVAPLLLVVVLGGPATPLQSASRFMLAMFPVFVVLARAGRRRWFHTSWLIASSMGLALLLTGILMNVPVG